MGGNELLAVLVFVDQLDIGVKEPIHLVAEPRLNATASAAVVVDAERSHELGQRTTQNQLAALGPYRFGRDPSQQQTGQVAEGELVAATGDHVELVRPVDALVLFPVAGVAPGQRAQRHRAAHEAQIGVRFAGRDKLVHLIGHGEVVLCLRRGIADRLHRPVQAADDFRNGNQIGRVDAAWLILPWGSDSLGAGSFQRPNGPNSPEPSSAC